MNHPDNLREKDQDILGWVPRFPRRRVSGH